MMVVKHKGDRAKYFRLKWEKQVMSKGDAINVMGQEGRI
jgi:hypothetical protein